MVVINFTIESSFRIGVATRRLVRSIVGSSVIAQTVAVVVDVNACVRDSVVVVIGVKHIEDSVVVVIRVGRVWCAIVVVVRIDEVRNTVSIKIAVNDIYERWRALCTLCAWSLTIGADSCSFPSDVVHATRIVSVVNEIPNDWGIKEVACCNVARCDGCIIWMGIINVSDVVVVIVWVKVIHDSIRIVIAWPSKLVDSSIIVIVFVETTRS